MSGVEISSERERLDVAAIHAFLSQTYWAQGISRERVAKSIDESLCFGMFASGRQIGFARVVTDRATFAYLCDVYVLEEFRGRGLGKRLVESVRAHSDLRDLRRFVLWTRDAHALYERFGFARLGEQPGLMGLVRPFGYRADGRDAQPGEGRPESGDASGAKPRAQRGEAPRSQIEGAPHE